MLLQYIGSNTFYDHMECESVTHLVVRTFFIVDIQHFA